MNAIPQPKRNAPLNLAQTCISFKDPAGAVHLKENAVYRTVSSFWVPTLQKCLNNRVVKKLIAEGKIISSETLETNAQATILQHPKVDYISYPHEWPQAQLYQAAKLTLELAEALLPEGLGLKDATPRNILFTNSRPVFIDILSFEDRHPNDATWRPFEQFLKLFIYPLILARATGTTPSQYFLANPEGLDATAMYKILGIRAFHPRYFSLVALPHFLSTLFRGKSGNTSSYKNRYVSSKAEAQFVLKILFKHLRKGLERIYSPSGQTSHWSLYTTRHCPYDQTELKEKTDFVESVIKESKVQRVVDLGCNTGTFSRLAAKNGASVLAVDSDSESLNQIFYQAVKEKQSIAVLQMDLTHPSSAMGWQHRESLSFTERFENQFDLSLALALFHHITLAGIKLPQFIEFMSHTTKSHCIIEYIAPEDQNFVSGLRGRTDLTTGINQQSFEAEVKKYFTIEKTMPLTNNRRVLYSLRKHR